ncbi:hypothetical protein HQ524_04400 [Candidatus Uhrbacteria bacterium]|nr:hypothetical protein [Candidatus Uhrbacteria bacterium]
MNTITDSHWDAFQQLLREIQTTTEIPIDFPGIETALLRAVGGRFPHGSAALCLATKDEEFIARGQQARLPLLVAATGTPQGRKGFNAPTLAVKVFQLNTSPPMFWFAYDVFPDGRRVLWFMDALRLDDDWRKSVCDSERLDQEARAFTAKAPHYLHLLTTLVEGFNGHGNKRTEDAKASALESLRRMLN